jgi:hypothetical protein
MERDTPATFSAATNASCDIDLAELQHLYVCRRSFALTSLRSARTVSRAKYLCGV